MDKEYVSRMEVANEAASNFFDSVQRSGNLQMLENDSAIEELFWSAFDAATNASEEELDFYENITMYLMYKSILQIRGNKFAKELRGRKTITVQEFNALCLSWIEYLNGAIEENDRNKPKYEAMKASFIESFKKDLGDLGFTIQTGGCYIATAVYGSYDCPQVWVLRRYRDTVLAANILGRIFIRIYYWISPYLVKRFSASKWFVKLWGNLLDTFVKKLKEAGYADTPYADSDAQGERNR